MYAVIETGGKQYKATVGATIDVEKLDAEVGQAIELDRVLMVAEEGRVRVGRPILDNATVSATVVEHGRRRKVIVFKYRAKQRYRRKAGHRQWYTRLRIDAIKGG
ncbi:50S ribosomal protein L21 [subsurface metagenome]